MASPVLFLLIATLLPLAGFGLLLFIGKRMGMPLAGWVGSAFSIASFGCTLFAMVRWYEEMHGAETWGFRVRPILRAIGWLPAGPGLQQRTPGLLDVGIYIDSLTVAMFATVTLVSAIAHIFSVGFMRRDEHFGRYFACLGLASFAILGEVLSATMLQVLAFWGLIGISSALLVGFRFEDLSFSNAALKTFIIQRLGDCGLLIGVGLLFSKLGNVTLPFLFATLGDAAGGHAVLLPDGSVLSLPFLTAAGLCLFFGAAVRSAQFPFQVWLVGASENLIPSGAMICSVTTTAAGVYLVARLFPILTPEARLAIAIIGVTTLTMAGLIAVVKRDLARLLVWTTVSQVGYMMLAMGVGSWVGGLFHLITHAFIMALLFLAAASVIAANGRDLDMLKLAGGWRRLPVTASAFAVAALAMAGAPFLGKYYSQSMIVTDAAAFAIFAAGAGGRAWGYWLFFALPTVMAYVTAFSMGRCWMLTFFGKSQDPQTSSPIREQPALWVPMLSLVVPAVIAGYAMNVPEMLAASILETRAMCDDLLDRTQHVQPARLTAFDQAWPTVRPLAPESDTTDSEDAAPVPSPAARAFEQGHAVVHIWLPWAWLAGIGLAVICYWKGDGLAVRLTRRQPLRAIHAWLGNEMYFDELYEWTIVRGVLGFATAVDVLDRHVLDSLVKGIAWLGRRARRTRLAKK